MAILLLFSSLGKLAIFKEYWKVVPLNNSEFYLIDVATLVFANLQAADIFFYCPSGKRNLGQDKILPIAAY